MDPEVIAKVSTLLSPLFPSLAPFSAPTIARLGGACINGSSPLYLALNFLPRAPQPSPFLEARHSFVLTYVTRAHWAGLGHNVEEVRAAMVSALLAPGPLYLYARDWGREKARVASATASAPPKLC